MTPRQRTSTKRQRTPRRGAALLVCLFIIFVVTLLTVNVLDTETLELSAMRNAIEYELALALASAGIQHAAAELESSPAWRGTVVDGAYPGNDTYSATAATGANNTVVVTSRGVAGGATRTIVATIEL